jgi:hypothetical protein
MGAKQMNLLGWVPYTSFLFLFAERCHIFLNPTLIQTRKMYT